MILKQLDVTNRRGSVLHLPFEDISSGFVVKEIEGLEPVKATLVSSSFANQDGEQYHSSRRETRNIKLHLELKPDYGLGTAKELRDKLYDYFMPKTKCDLNFHMVDKFASGIIDKILDLKIESRIESFDSPLFTSEPVVDISLLCFDPDFIDPNPVTISGMTTEDATEETIVYDGTVETGIIFTLLVDRAFSDFTIYHRLPDGTITTVDFSHYLLDGDVVKITSIPGLKSVMQTRSGVETSILYGIYPQSGWIELQPGDNFIRVYSVGDPIPYTIEYVTRYGGL